MTALIAVLIVVLLYLVLLGIAALYIHKCPTPTRFIKCPHCEGTNAMSWHGHIISCPDCGFNLFEEDHEQ